MDSLEKTLIVQSPQSKRQELLNFLIKELRRYEHHPKRANSIMKLIEKLAKQIKQDKEEEDEDLQRKTKGSTVAGKEAGNN